MKIDRLLAITIYLLNHRRTSAQDLANRFEVSTRTIMRDIDSLCLAGIPVVSTFGVDGGYEIMETFQMEKQVAGEIDYSFILTALKGLSTAYPNRELENTIEKLHCLGEHSNQSIQIDLGVANEHKEINTLLSLLSHAIKIRHIAKFTYTNSDNIRKSVAVEPVSIIYKWYHWYLLAYQPKHESYCIYKLIRMEHLIIQEQENTILHNPKEAMQCWESKNETRDMTTIKLMCSSNIRSRCLEYLNGTIIEEYSNGDFLYEIIVPENEQFWFGTVLSFGDKVKVLEPPEIIEKIVTTCNQVINQYKDQE